MAWEKNALRYQTQELMCTARGEGLWMKWECFWESSTTEMWDMLQGLSCSNEIERQPALEKLEILQVDVQVSLMWHRKAMPWIMLSTTWANALSIWVMLFLLQPREHTDMSWHPELQHQRYVSLHLNNKKVSLIAKQALSVWEEVPVKTFEGLHWIRLCK